METNMEKKIFYCCVPKSDGSFRIEEKLLYKPWRNYFPTKEDARNHFEKAEKKALDKYEKIAKGIHELKEKFGDFTYDCEVFVHDDSGLETSVVIEFDIDGYAFKFNV